MQDLYFYTAVTAVVLGVAIGTAGFWLSPPIWLWLSFMGVTVWVVLRRAHYAVAPSWLISIPLFLVVFALTLTRVASLPSTVVPALETELGRTVTLEGIVVREPDRRESSTHLYIKTSDTIVLAFVDRFDTAVYGDRVRVHGKLEKPAVFTTDFGRTFNYPGYLRARGVGYIVSFADATVHDSGHGYVLVAGLLAAKQAFMAELELRLPQPQVGLAEGLLLGVKRALGADYEAAFRETGITHIVVLSGYNIMLVVAFFMFVLANVFPYRVRLIVGIVGIACFALLVGLSATVVRASAMATLLLLVRFGGLTHHILRALFFTGAVMLLMNPLLLFYDIGFQLSFMATFALIVVAPRVEAWFAWAPDFASIREFFVATVTTQLFVTPLVLYHIGQTSVVAILVNVLVLPIVPAAMLLTFTTGMVSFVLPFLAAPVAWLAYLLLSYILNIAQTFAQLPFAAITVPPFSAWVLLLVYGCGAALWWYGTKRPPHVTSVVSDSDFRHWTIVAERES